MNKRLLPFLPAIGWWLLSLYLFTLPGAAFPKTDWLDDVQADKWIHIFLFAVLVFLFLRPLKPRWMLAPGKNWLIIVPAIALAYGIAIEFVQQNFIANRSFDKGDIVADAIGCAIPALLAWRRRKSTAA